MRFDRAAAAIVMLAPASVSGAERPRPIVAVFDVHDDVERLATSVTTTFNLEMACTGEMLAIAERLRPHQVMFVPERRQEITTEGGLDVSRDPDRIRDGIARMKAAGIPTSLFIGADRETIAHGQNGVSSGSAPVTCASPSQVRRKTSGRTSIAMSQRTPSHC